MDVKAQEALWAAAVLQNEQMLDGIYKKLRARHGEWTFTSLGFDFVRDTFLKRVRGWCGVSPTLTKGDMADAGDEMTPFPQPIELDCVFDTTWLPVAEEVKNIAERRGVKLLIVAHHPKKIWEQWLAGSVSKYLIDEATMPVVVVHG